MRLYIGNRNYSSWSMRPWLALRHAGIPFEEVVLPLYEPETVQRMKSVSPTGKVPCLVMDIPGESTGEKKPEEVVIWDSLAICETLAELFPQARLWPQAMAARAEARAVTAEMHSGFMLLRQTFPMNVRASLSGRGWPEDEAARQAVERELARVDQIWSTLTARHACSGEGKGSDGGPFLFGHFTIADCFYAPVVLRCEIWGLPLSPAARAYADAVLAHPAVVEWVQAAKAEPWRIERFERDA